MKKPELFELRLENYNDKGIIFFQAPEWIGAFEVKNNIRFWIWYIDLQCNLYGFGNKDKRYNHHWDYNFKYSSKEKTLDFVKENYPDQFEYLLFSKFIL